PPSPSGTHALLFPTLPAYQHFGLYDTQFISPQAFSYYSRAAKTLDDPLEKALVENSYQRYVFARINKLESYFFLGLVSKW
ncbi:hypothetical protein, partial [Francisella tularensis]|uniref:hypothetical protein n=1 Tax=Francisella tularensis TaxID=263 RepID=UPI002381AEC6